MVNIYLVRHGKTMFNTIGRAQGWSDTPLTAAVGIKLSVGMEIPKELEGKFKFARQRSKLAGEIRGSYFTIKQEWL